jgi:site-specific recombinase XerD
VAENTWETYNTALNTFNEFRDSYNLDKNWPARFQHIVFFISFCFEQGLSPKSIKTYISGLNFFHKMHGWYDIGEQFIVKKLLEGCARLRKTKDSRAPITLKILQTLRAQLPKVCYNEYETKLFSALWVLAYFGLFRVSELVKCNNFTPNGPINIDNIKFSQNRRAVSLCLSHFRTNQTNKPVWLRIPEEPNLELCPVKSLFEFISLRPRFPGPLFCHADGSAVTRYQFAKVLSKCIERTQYNILKFRTHSFRIGRATDLAAAGVPEPAIMRLGRWSSSAYKLYLR